MTPRVAGFISGDPFVNSKLSTNLSGLPPAFDTELSLFRDEASILGVFGSASPAGVRSITVYG